MFTIDGIRYTSEGLKDLRYRAEGRRVALELRKEEPVTLEWAIWWAHLQLLAESEFGPLAYALPVTDPTLTGARQVMLCLDTPYGTEYVTRKVRRRPEELIAAAQAIEAAYPEGLSHAL